MLKRVPACYTFTQFSIIRLEKLNSKELFMNVSNESLISLWETLADKALQKITPTREEGKQILNASSEETLAILQAAYRVRRHFHGNKVRIHVLQNAKSGACSEDCGFCSQSSKYQTPAAEYPIQTVEELVEGARKARAAGAWKYCMVTATRGPSNRDLDVIGYPHAGKSQTTRGSGSRPFQPQS